MTTATIDALKTAMAEALIEEAIKKYGPFIDAVTRASVPEIHSRVNLYRVFLVKTIIEGCEGFTSEQYDEQIDRFLEALRLDFKEAKNAFR